MRGRRVPIALLLAAASVAASAGPATAQVPAGKSGTPQFPGLGGAPGPYGPSPIGPSVPGAIVPGPPAIPGGSLPGAGGVPGGGPSMSDLAGPFPGPASGFDPTAPPSGAPTFAPELFAATGGDEFAIADVGGYIDGAIPRSRIRARYDTAYGMNDPSRAEFFYAACGCLRLFGNDFSAKGPTQGLPNLLRNANGSLQVYPSSAFTRQPDGSLALPAGTRLLNAGLEPNIDFQEFTPYFEYAATPRFSAFLDTPIRWINGTLIDNAGGFSDMRVGFKYAFVAEPDRFLTLQTKFYLPTGDAERGLGTGHPSIEPGLLYFRALSDRTFLFGEVRDWIPIQASDIGGNVLRYGLGASHNLIQTSRIRIAPVVEFVGWTVLSGQSLEAATDGSLNFRGAAGDTILNGKYGVRIGLGDYRQVGGASLLNDRHNIYIGYGNAYTGNHWYEDILRVEYQFYF